MNKYHWGKEKHSKEMAPYIYWFIMELKKRLEYRFDWPRVAYSVSSSNEFIVNQMYGCLGYLSNKSVK